MDAGGARLNEALHWNGRAWSLVSTPDPVGTSGTASQQLFGVACTSAKNCWAVGGTGVLGGAGLNEALHWSGGKWKSAPVTDPGGTSGSVNNVLHGISCPKASDCWAVGTARNSSGATTNQGLHWSGGRWASVAAPSPGQTSGMLLRLLSAVTCSSAADCKGGRRRRQPAQRAGERGAALQRGQVVGHAPSGPERHIRPRPQHLERGGLPGGPRLLGGGRIREQLQRSREPGLELQRPQMDSGRDCESQRQRRLCQQRAPGRGMPLGQGLLGRWIHEQLRRQGARRAPALEWEEVVEGLGKVVGRAASRGPAGRAASRGPAGARSLVSPAGARLFQRLAGGDQGEPREFQPGWGAPPSALGRRRPGRAPYT